MRPPKVPGAADFMLFMVFVMAIMGVAILLAAETDLTALRRVPGWFDPIYVQYNLVLATVAILLPPVVTYIYTMSMGAEKRRRLLRQLEPEEQAAVAEDVDRVIERSFRFRHYAGSVSLLVLVIGLGVYIMLLLKPAFCHEDACPHDVTGGVDYSRGANFLMLGPFIQFLESDIDLAFQQIVVGLTAFQFGFLGAYVYFIIELARAYFMLDLSPNVFIDSVVRMVIASLLSLVLSFALSIFPFFGTQDNEIFLRFLPIVAFFIGFFPSRGLLLIERLGAKATGAPVRRKDVEPLSALSGMSDSHEVRLKREGFDNWANLVHADPIDLALRTGFSVGQLRDWVGEAWLRQRLGPDYEAFRRAIGVATRRQFASLVAATDEAALDSLVKELPDPLPRKIAALAATIRTPSREGDLPPPG